MISALLTGDPSPLFPGLFSHTTFQAIHPSLDLDKCGLLGGPVKTSSGVYASATALPINKPTSASICGSLTFCKCGHPLMSSCFGM